MADKLLHSQNRVQPAGVRIDMLISWTIYCCDPDYTNRKNMLGANMSYRSFPSCWRPLVSVSSASVVTTGSPVSRWRKRKFYFIFSILLMRDPSKLATLLTQYGVKSLWRLHFRREISSTFTTYISIYPNNHWI